MLLTELSSFHTQFQAVALLLFTFQTSPAAHMSYYPCSTFQTSIFGSRSSQCLNFSAIQCQSMLEATIWHTNLPSCLLCCLNTHEEFIQNYSETNQKTNKESESVLLT